MILSKIFENLLRWFDQNKVRFVSRSVILVCITFGARSEASASPARPRTQNLLRLTRVPSFLEMMARVHVTEKVPTVQYVVALNRQPRAQHTNLKITAHYLRFLDD
jgi:hypothetical protein